MEESYDAVVVGGGPAGTTFARLLQRHGPHRILVVERSEHPRFCVGESLLPGSMPVFRELGLLERFEKAGFVRKYGAYFCFEDGAAPEYFHFPDARGSSEPFAYEVPRAQLDQLLWDAAREDGIECVDRTAITSVHFEGDRATGVALKPEGGPARRVHARLVVDCSGRSTLLARQRGIRVRDPRLDTVALYRHYGEVVRSTGEDAGTIAIVATDFGWMWLIPFSDGAASVGATIRRGWYAERRKASHSREEIWGEILARVPAVSRRLEAATPTRALEVTADFQYRARELAGDGWVLVGDAGAFLDPVFSSGVHLAVHGARRAAAAAARALAGDGLPRRAHFTRYARQTRGLLRAYGRFICAWYDPDFRQVLMRPPHGRPGVEVLKREVLAVLAGTELRPWRTLPALASLQLFAHLRRAGRRRA